VVSFADEGPEVRTQDILSIGEVMNAKELAIGSMKSKTQWIGVIVIVLGILQDQSQMLSILIGPEHMGKVMAAIGLVFMVLRAVTSTSLAEKQ